MMRRGLIEYSAYIHHELLADLLADDPRYQALLEEAGITW